MYCSSCHFFSWHVFLTYRFLCSVYDTGSQELMKRTQQEVTVLFFSVFLVVSQWGRGRLSGQTFTSCEHDPVTTQTNNQPMQIRTTATTHQQENHLHGRPPTLVQWTWGTIQRSVRYWWVEYCHKLKALYQVSYCKLILSYFKFCSMV